MAKSRNRKEAEATIDRWTSGKGDSYRPVDKKKFDRNYDHIFRKKEVEDE